MAKIKNPNTEKLDSLSMYLAPKSCTGFEKDSFRALTRDQQIKIARFACPWFNPPHDTTPDKKYNKVWWDSMLMENGAPSDKNSTAAWACMFPERTAENYSPTKQYAKVDFYVNVDHSNALCWLAICPQHLRQKVLDEFAKLPKGSEANRSSKYYEAVFKVWGDRPELPEEPKDPLDGVSIDGIMRAEVWREWVHMYDELVLTDLVVEMAPRIQEERRSLARALGLNSDDAALPNQAVGLDDTQAATVRWLQLSGDTPLEFLARMYRDETAKPGDRIAAARTLMDYAHRKIPVKQELETKAITEPKLDPKLLKGLSAKELEVLENLLKKMSGE